jgi:hypothetical protein
MDKPYYQNIYGTSGPFPDINSASGALSGGNIAMFP